MLELRSPREIALMRTPCQLVREAHLRAAEMVRPGITTGEIDAVIEQLFRQHDAEPLFKGVPPMAAAPRRGRVAAPFPAVSCISVNEEVVHGIPGRRVLKPGDVVSIDTGCRVQGWCGDAAVTHAVGDVDPQAQQLLSVTQAALQLAIQLLASETHWSHIALQMHALVKQAGFAVVEAMVGHGIGRDLHEAPQVPNCDPRRIRDWIDFKIQPGLVLAIEPMVNVGKKDVRVLRDGWTVVTCDGSRSAHFEHTVAITADGPEVLTS